MLAEKINFSITRMARLLQVSRSGYYAWLKRQNQPGPRALRRSLVEQQVLQSHARSGGVYGSPRITADLRAAGTRISRKTVARTMASLGLQGVYPRRWQTTTQRNNQDTYPADQVRRQWDQGAPNQVWVGDLTYLRTWEGWLYLAVVMDAHTRRIIGWAISEQMDTTLVEDALRMALALRERKPGQVVFHTDRGTQYAATGFRAYSASQGVTSSMGATGVAWDNAMAESFFATLKTEFYYRNSWPTKTGATQGVGRWIEETYNRTRRHSALGQVAPVAYEQTYYNQQHQPLAA